MDFFEAVERRASYRGEFTDQSIPREDLRRIVRAGQCAPSGMNAQTTHFVIVDAADILASISSLPDTNPALRNARALIACITDRNPQPVVRDLHFQVEDCAAAAENMLLAITALGYGGVWIDGWLRADQRADDVGRILGLPEEKVVRILIPLGIPANTPEPKRKAPFGERAWFNQYGAPETDHA